MKPLDGWSVVSRGRFETRHDGHRWTVDADFLDFGRKLKLYRDGMLVDTRKSPATFGLGAGATIKASMAYSACGKSISWSTARQRCWRG
jgi:hypothetical protein